MLKVGAVGSACFAYGLWNYKNMGGFYRPGKRKPGDPGFGQARIGSVTLPSIFSFAPLMFPAQFGATIGWWWDEHKQEPGAATFLQALVDTSSNLINDLPAFNSTESLKNLSKKEVGLSAGAELRSAIPGAVQYAAKILDPASPGFDPFLQNTQPRKPETFGQELEYGIPGLRQNVPTKTEAAEESKARAKEKRAFEKQTLTAPRTRSIGQRAARTKEPRTVRGSR
jgi:hypothetical protein